MARQVERLGYRREDVRHIVLTHLDMDHAGGLRVFQTLIELKRQERLRELARAQFGKVRVFCVHDEEEWRRLAEQPGAPATSSAA
jgi:glyoxylase-like metal-dependent hydrolase (beta-lactamase superfamily II)